MESEGEISSFRKFKMALNPLHGKRGGLMVSVLVFGSSSSDSKPGWGHCVVFLSWARHFTLAVPLSTQVYKWVPTNLMLGITLRWTGIPSRESRNTPSCFMP